MKKSEYSIEELLTTKDFEVLTTEERQHALNMLESDEKYKALRKSFNIIANSVAEDVTSIDPNPGIEQRLLNRMAIKPHSTKVQRTSFIDLLIHLVSPENLVLKMGFVCLLIAITLFFNIGGLENSASPISDSTHVRIDTSWNRWDTSSYSNTSRISINSDLTSERGDLAVIFANVMFEHGPKRLYKILPDATRIVGIHIPIFCS